MSELSEDSGHSALKCIIGKISDSRRDARILGSPEGAKLVRASKDEISTGLWNLLSSFNQPDENWFNAKDTGQCSIFNGPFGVTLIVSLSDACENTARTTELIASFRFDNKNSHSRPESTLLEELRLMPLTRADGEIAWSRKADTDDCLGAAEVVSLVAEKLANYISRRFRGADGQPRKENLKQALRVAAVA
ncbi:MAG TPA: hypothetical protein VIS96_12200 [Terrimicrobiaceae bacterium]